MKIDDKYKIVSVEDYDILKKGIERLNSEMEAFEKEKKSFEDGLICKTYANRYAFSADIHTHYYSKDYIYDEIDDRHERHTKWYKNEMERLNSEIEILKKGKKLFR